MTKDEAMNAACRLMRAVATPNNEIIDPHILAVIMTAEASGNTEPLIRMLNDLKGFVESLVAALEG